MLLISGVTGLVSEEPVKDAVTAMSDAIWTIGFFSEWREYEELVLKRKMIPCCRDTRLMPIWWRV